MLTIAGGIVLAFLIIRSLQVVLSPSQEELDRKQKMKEVADFLSSREPPR